MRVVAAKEELRKFCEGDDDVAVIEFPQLSSDEVQELPHRSMRPELLIQLDADRVPDAKRGEDGRRPGFLVLCPSRSSIEGGHLLEVQRLSNATSEPLIELPFRWLKNFDGP